MTATQAPTPGPLDSKSVKLLVKGDLLKIAPGRIGAGNIVVFDKRDGSLVFEEGDDESYYPDCYIFHSRPSLAAPTAPVEASGSEREDDAQWLLDNYGAGHPRIQRIANRLRPQPSGETREAVARIIDPTAWEILDQRGAKSAEKIGITTARSLEKTDAILALLSARPLALGGQNSSGEGYVLVPIEPTEAMRKAGKDAIGWNPAPEIKAIGVYRDMIAAYTPARAETQDEGAAGEDSPITAAIRAKLEKVKATTYHAGTPAERMKEGKLDGLNTALAIAMVEDDRAASAHPSPTPAADADRVREAHEQAVRLRRLKHRLLKRKATLGDMDDLVEVIHFLEMPAVSSFATPEAK